MPLIHNETNESHTVSCIRYDGRLGGGGRGRPGRSDGADGTHDADVLVVATVGEPPAAVLAVCQALLGGRTPHIVHPDRTTSGTEPCAVHPHAAVRSERD